MGSNGEGNTTEQKDEIRSSLNSIISISEKWVRRLQSRESKVRLASAFLTFLLLFFILSGITISYVFEYYNVDFFRGHGMLIFTVLLTNFIITLGIGIASYFFWGKKRRMSIQELSNLTTELKKEGNLANSLALAERLFTLLPEVVRKRNQDSFLFGVVAFVLSLIVAHSLEIALVIGVIVWLYFRYEMNKYYDLEIAKFEEQKRIFEERKKEFLETL